MSTSERWVCVSCGYIYEPRAGDAQQQVAPGTAFEDLPQGWRCPMCYAPRSEFDPLD